MADYKMVDVGTDEKGNTLYNVRKAQGGELVVEGALTEAEALAVMNKSPKPKSSSAKPSYKSMNKVELEAFMREHGIELDRRKSKGDLLEQVDEYFKDNF
jgi:hypothetical protein|tara:strand:- start:180 stop:479 length:300 start_codon:yes stop_codon:yes gene_type:complete